MLLQTKVVSIEYDEGHREQAEKLQKIINQNSDFFQVFLKANKISFIDKKSSLYLKESKDIFNHLDGISPSVASTIMNDGMTDELKEATALYWYTKIYDGKYEFEPEEHLYECGIVDYFRNNGTWQDLYNYFHKTSPVTEKDIFSWIKEEYRYVISTITISDNISSLLIEQFPESKVEEDERLLEQILQLASEIKEIENSYLEEIPITYPMSKEESISLFKNFLYCLDPTRKLLSFAEQMEKDDVWVSDPNDERLSEEDITGSPGLINADPPFIYMPWTNTIDDAATSVHEFFHYYTKMHTTKEQYTYPLTELAPIFFEELFYYYLLAKKYPNEVVGSLMFNRRVTIAKNAQDIYDAILLEKTILEKGEITPQDELTLFGQELPEVYSEEEIQTILKFNCDERNKKYIQDPEYIAFIFPYVIGQKISEILLDRASEDKDEISSMLNFAKEAGNWSLEESLQKLNVQPFSTPKEKIKE